MARRAKGRQAQQRSVQQTHHSQIEEEEVQGLGAAMCISSPSRSLSRYLRIPGSGPVFIIMEFLEGLGRFDMGCAFMWSWRNLKGSNEIGIEQSRHA